ncbi:otu-like cysteine protease domain-containing [Nannochloropsis oceanica]
MMVGSELHWQQHQLQPEGDEGRLTLTSSMSFRPLEEDPQWGLFLPFDSLEFSFVGGAIGVCRPVPDEFSTIYISTLTMVKPTIQRVTGLGSIFLGTKKKEVMLWGQPLKPFTSSSISSSSSSSSSSSEPPADDLRLADQMLRLALVGNPQCYSFWYLQYFNSKDVSQLLGRKEEGREGAMAGTGGEDNCRQSPAKREEGPVVDSSPAGEEGKIKMEVDVQNTEGKEEEGMEEESVIENDIIISKIESMTGTRILVAPYEGGKGLRRCFLLMGEEELVAKARNHLQGAITQKISPTGREVAALLAGQEGGNGGGEIDERLEEIRKELRDKHRLRMMEVQRDGNCLFRALSVFEHKTETKHRAVRAAIVARLKEAPEAMEVTALVEGITSEEYLRRMAEDRQWGGYTECMAWSEARKKHVRLYVENEMIGLRCTDIECAGVAEEEEGKEKVRVQLLLYKSHYWLCMRG